jgi:lysophospholipase L1-like esterase
VDSGGWLGADAADGDPAAAGWLTLRTVGIVLFNVAAVCGIVLGAEFVARLALDDRGGEGNSLVLDRWAAFRTSANFDRAGVHHNAQGFRRDWDVSIDKPANTVRIFLMGASVAYGDHGLYQEIDDRWNPSNHETIDFYLEQKLNATFPSRRWEVINAAVKGYLVHQDLMRLLSVVLQYKPDCVISMDGVNDVGVYGETGRRWDPYGQTGFIREFNQLTHPRWSGSMRTMIAAWLTTNSALFRWLENRAARRLVLEEHRRRVQENGIVPRDVDAAAFTLVEREQVQNALAKLSVYRRTLRQMHRIAEIDRVEDFFVLQPMLQLTRKKLTDREARMAEYDRSVAGRVETYVTMTAYPLLAKQLAADSASEGYGFADLTDVFDGTEEQAFSDYCHLTPAGNRVVADRLFEIIRGSSVVPHLH